MAYSRSTGMVSIVSFLLRNIEQALIDRARTSKMMILVARIERVRMLERMGMIAETGPRPGEGL
ncbi:hypothetical protein GCM10009552_24480 [Rothia nasimurium]